MSNWIKTVGGRGREGEREREDTRRMAEVNVHVDGQNDRQIKPVLLMLIKYMQ